MLVRPIAHRAIAMHHRQSPLTRASKEAAQFRLERNRRSLKKLKKLIEQLRVDPFGRLDVLFRLQTLLAKYILRTEKGLRILKNERFRLSKLRKDRPSREASALIKEREERIRRGVENGKHLLWIWRCFGDAIPFIYHDKHALKHMLYSIEDYSVKQSAGSLSGNFGRSLERDIMQEFCNRGIPAMLCDLTNTLRHGDVCVMVGADPFPIEVKSSKNQNARTARQADNLAALHAFFSENKASNFRGVERVERREVPMAKTHLAELQLSIDMSRGRRSSLVHSEEGVTYIAVRRGSADHMEGEDIGVHPQYFLWNEAIDWEAWMPYYPFTLSITRGADLVALLEDRLMIIVTIDAHAIMKRFAERGFIATFMEDENIAITVRRPNTSFERGDAVCGISNHLLRRVLVECEPVSNIIDFATKFITELEDMEPSVPEDMGKLDAQMLSAWRALVPALPPLLSDDPVI